MGKFFDKNHVSLLKFCSLSRNWLKIIIEYLDQNYHFEKIFPLHGTIINTLNIAQKKFFLVQIDRPFTYLDVLYDQIVIKERHVGHYIGPKKETHVLVLLPKTSLNEKEYSLEQFDHVVWATVFPKDYYSTK